MHWGWFSVWGDADETEMLFQGFQTQTRLTSPLKEDFCHVFESCSRGNQIYKRNRSWVCNNVLWCKFKRLEMMTNKRDRSRIGTVQEGGVSFCDGYRTCSCEGRD